MTENMAGRGEGLADRLTESIWAISDGQHPDKDTLRNLIRNILAAAPAGTAHASRQVTSDCLDQLREMLDRKDLSGADLYALNEAITALATPSPQPSKLLGAEKHLELCCACNHGRSPCEEYKRNYAPAATQEPAGSGALTVEQEHAQWHEQNGVTEPGSPRKVGEDGASADEARLHEARWWIAYSLRMDDEDPERAQAERRIADLERAAAVPVGEQKQEEGV